MWFRRKVNQVTPRRGILLGDISCLVTTGTSQAAFLIFGSPYSIHTCYIVALHLLGVIIAEARNPACQE